MPVTAWVLRRPGAGNALVTLVRPALAALCFLTGCSESSFHSFWGAYLLYVTLVEVAISCTVLEVLCACQQLSSLLLAFLPARMLVHLRVCAASLTSWWALMVCRR